MCTKVAVKHQSIELKEGSQWQTFISSPTDYDEILKVLRDLKQNSGHGNIMLELLKLIDTYVAYPNGILKAK